MNDNNASSGGFGAAEDSGITSSASGDAYGASAAGRGAEDTTGSVIGNAPWNGSEQEGNFNNSGPITADEAAILNPGTVGLDEEFAGTGGAGSVGSTDILRGGGMESGSDYNPDLGNNIPDTDGAQGRT
jgi:hypothetical protein